MKRVLLFALLLPACSLKDPTVRCDGPEDCLLPLVCCQGGLGTELTEVGAPVCLSREICTAGGGTYTPFFPEGAPCGRSSTAEGCAPDLVCCDRTLTCLAADTCASQPTPPATTYDETIACGADSECPGGVCCGIDWINREGACASVAACGATNQITVPQRDGGVSVDSGVDAGVMPTLAERICERSFCDRRGEIPPTAGQRSSCVEMFADGVDGEGRTGVVASEACLAAVEASRALCGVAFRWRDTVVPEVDRTKPILPGPCYAPALNAPLAAAACAVIVDRGLATDAAACASWVSSLSHDLLSRIATAPARLDPLELGYAARPLLGRCEVDSHCPDGATCLADLAFGGVCTVPSCSADNTCLNLGGVCDADFCTLPCSPTLQNIAARQVPAGQCASRVPLEGEPRQFACAARISGGVCVPALDPASCASGAETLDTPPLGRIEGAFECSLTTTSTLTLFDRCTPGEPDPCAQGVCPADVASPRCMNPCVVAPVGVDGPTCPADQVCTHPTTAGWGAAGYCFAVCPPSRTCPDGNACVQGWPDRYCP